MLSLAFIRVVISLNLLRRFLPLLIMRMTRPLRVHPRMQHLQASSCEQHGHIRHWIICSSDLATCLDTPPRPTHTA